MRKGTAAAALAGGLAMSLAACGGSGDGGSGSGGDGGKDGAVTITWNMWAGDAEAEAKLEAQMAAAQEVVGDDIVITLETAPWADFFTKLNANLSSGNLACVTAMNGQRMAGYHEAFLPLGDEELATAGISADDYNEGALSVMRYDGGLYGLPYDTATMFLYYNADLFEQAGVALPTNDWTIQDFEDAAVAVTEGTGVKGFAVSLDEFQWLSLPMAYSGLQAVNEDMELDLTDPDFVEAATWYASLATDLGASDAPPSASEQSWDANQFTAGTAAMAIDGSWNATSYTSGNDAFTGGVVRIPAGDSGPYGVALGYGVAANCENPDEALKVLGALAGPEVQKVIAEQGGYPAQLGSQSLYFDALPADYADGIEAAFDAGFENANGQRVVDAWTQVSESFPTELISVYTGQASMADTLDKLQSKFGG
jgi:multiple sugar transport system substrate-binding protein